MKKPTLKEVILELSFTEEIIVWAHSHPEFLDALKNVYPDKFISPCMLIEHPPIRGSDKHNGDIVIGVYTYHYDLGKPVFKQDFIVNKGGQNKEFVLYSRNPAGSSKYVKDITTFFESYEQYGHSKTDHHLSLEELPYELKERAQEAIRISKIATPELITQEHIDKIYKEVMAIDRKDRFFRVKLKSK